MPQRDLDVIWYGSSLVRARSSLRLKCGYAQDDAFVTLLMILAQRW